MIAGKKYNQKKINAANNITKQGDIKQVRKVFGKDSYPEMAHYKFESAGNFLTLVKHAVAGLEESKMKVNMFSVSRFMGICSTTYTKTCHRFGLDERRTIYDLLLKIRKGG